MKQSILTNTIWGTKQVPTQIPMDEILSIVISLLRASKPAEFLNNVAKMTPFPIKVTPTTNMANKKEGPNLSLGINVIGPFFRNRVTPNEAEKTLVTNVARKKLSLNCMPSK